MHYVKFDYAWNMTLLVILSIIHSVLWLVWAWKTRPSYLRHLLIPIAVTAILSSLELFDFEPLLLIFDPHSLWHLGIIGMAILLKNFLVIDAKHCISLHDKQNKLL